VHQKARHLAPFFERIDILVQTANWRTHIHIGRPPN
jgi:hypothetical protein